MLRRRRSLPSPSTAARRALALAALTAALAIPAAAQRGDTARAEAVPRRYSATLWNTEHGLPSSIVNDVAQTADGYLWAAMYEGLVRFDGTTFRTFTDDDIPGLERGSFLKLLVQPAPAGDPAGGTLWAASESGELVRWRNGRWRVFQVRDGLPGVSINSLALDHDGTLLLGSRVGVWRLEGERAAPLPWPAGQVAPAVAALAADDRGTIWVGTVSDGLLRVRDGRVTRLTTRDGLASDRIDALLVDRDGALWVGAYGASGVVRVRGDRIEHVGTRTARAGGAESGGAPRRVRALLRDRAGTLWLAAENGLFALRGAEPQVAELVPLGDPGAAVMGLHTGGVKAEALLEDAEGGLWIGTRQSGLFRLRATSFATLGAADGLPHPFAFAVDGDGRGGAWVGTRDGAVHLPASAAAGATQLLLGQPVRDLLRTSDGDVWIGTTVGLTRLVGGRVDRAVTYTRADGLTDDRVRAFAAGRGGALWIATFDGVSEWRDGRFHRYGRAEGLTDGYVLGVLEDAAGTLWVGTQAAGLFRCPAPRADAPPSARRTCEPGPRELAGQPVFRLLEDADGTLWAGTTRGLARLRRRVPHGPVTDVALLTPRHGLPGRTIFQAVDDGRGALWLTGPWGIGRAERRALHAVADGRAASLDVTPFGRGDGMAAREASSISRAWRAPDGTLWFPTPLGVSVVDPARLPPRAVAPRAHLEQVLADGVTLDLHAAAGEDGAIALRPGTRALEFRVSVPSLTAPERVRLRWRLEPFDSVWVAGDTRRVAEYTYLPPDTYRFTVQARVGDGPWGDAAGATLRLVPHLWQRPVVALSAALALLALVALAHHRRTRVLLRRGAARAAQAAREEALREASLRDELTGLYNRRGLLALAEQELRGAAREGRGSTLLFADLDGLKAINDTLGHAAGDRALEEAAAVLRATFRDADVVARLGGDEFVVLLRDPSGGPGEAPTEPAAVLAAAQDRLAVALALHNARDGRPFPLTISVGSSRFDPAAPRSMEALLADADRRMYGVKRARRATRENVAIGEGATRRH